MRTSGNPDTIRLVPGMSDGNRFAAPVPGKPAIFSGTPPAADTRHIGPSSVEYRIVSSAAQRPPDPEPPVVATICGGPPPSVTFLSALLAKNAMLELAGDQNGK